MQPPHIQFLLILSMLGTVVLVCTAIGAAWLTCLVIGMTYAGFRRHSWALSLYWSAVVLLLCVAATAGLVGACDAVFYFWSH